MFIAVVVSRCHIIISMGKYIWKGYQLPNIWPHEVRTQNFSFGAITNGEIKAGTWRILVSHGETNINDTRNMFAVEYGLEE